MNKYSIMGVLRERKPSLCCKTWCHYCILSILRNQAE
jgi:hypothetical protein